MNRINQSTRPRSKRPPVDGRVADSRWGGSKLGGRPIEPLALPTEFDAATCSLPQLPSLWWDDYVDEETPTERANRHARAREVCEKCPIASLCAEYAHSHREAVAGIWGGEYLPQTD